MSELLIESAVHGIAPRSDQLLTLGGDVERGRSTQADFDEQVAIETADWLALQAEAGITYPEDGKLRWQDHLRPIVAATEGFAPGINDAPVTRWYYSNTFYREPTITGDLEFNPKVFEEQVGPLGPNVSLLAPDTFASLCRNRFDGIPADRNVWRLYSDILAHFEDSGVKRVLFEDYIPGGTTLQPLDSLERHSAWYPGLQLGLLTHHGVHPNTVALPVDEATNIGVTIPSSVLSHIAKNTPRGLRPRLNNVEIIQPIVDGTRTDRPQHTLDRDQVRVIAECNPARVVLTHSIDLERLPLRYAQEKVKLLGELARQAQAEVASL
ncbi:MAG: Cobalamin-independent synthase MetE-like protein [Candidatus Saccharibacteria bacterium]|nr:Cobalamin-independent synthase MetE-like protein [Candidatus Saccharibacteria bacterium]